MAKGRSGGHHMQLVRRGTSKRDRARAAEHRRRRSEKIRNAKPKIIRMSMNDHTILEISAVVGLEPFVVDAILRKEAQ